MVETAQAEASENWKWSRSRIQTASGTYLETDSPWNSWSGSTTHCWIVPLGTPGVDSVTTIFFLFPHAVVSMAILTGKTVHRQLLEISWADARHIVSQSEFVTTKILNGLLAFDHLHSCSRQDWLRLSDLSVCQLPIVLTLKSQVVCLPQTAHQWCGCATDHMDFAAI